MWRALVLIALTGCVTSLVDEPAAKIQKLCADHPFHGGDHYCATSTSSGCPGIHSDDMSCEDVIASIPNGCIATADDYIACATTSCASMEEDCKAFIDCGVHIWTRFRPPSCA